MARKKKTDTKEKIMDKEYSEEEFSEDKEGISHDDELEQLVKDGEKELFAQNSDIKSLSPERLERNRQIALLAWSDNEAEQRLAKEYACLDCRAYVESLVRFMLGHCKNGSIVDAEDCTQEVYKHICKAIKEYDPKYSLLTFVKPKIVRAIQEARSKNSGVSTYYMSNARPINDAIAKLAEKGIFNPSEKDLQIMTGLPMKTIVNTRGQMHAAQEKRIEDSTYDYLDSATGSRESSTIYSASPESVLERKEQISIVRQAVSQLSELEQSIIWARNDKVNWQTIAIKNEKEPEQVKKIYAEALKKLRMSRILAPYKYGNKGNRSKFEHLEIPIYPVELATKILDDIDSYDMSSSAVDTSTDTSDAAHRKDPHQSV